MSVHEIPSRTQPLMSNRRAVGKRNHRPECKGASEISPFLVRRPQPAALFDALQLRTPTFRARWFRNVVRQSPRAPARAPRRQAPASASISICHPGPVFPQIDGHHLFHRHRQFTGHANEAGLELDKSLPIISLLLASRPIMSTICPSRMNSRGTRVRAIDPHGNIRVSRYRGTIPRWPATGGVWSTVPWPTLSPFRTASAHR